MKSILFLILIALILSIRVQSQPYAMLIPQQGFGSSTITPIANIFAGVATNGLINGQLMTLSNWTNNAEIDLPIGWTEVNASTGAGTNNFYYFTNQLNLPPRPVMVKGTNYTGVGTGVVEISLTNITFDHYYATTWQGSATNEYTHCYWTSVSYSATPFGSYDIETESDGIANNNHYDQWRLYALAAPIFLWESNNFGVMQYTGLQNTAYFVAEQMTPGVSNVLWIYSTNKVMLTNFSYSLQAPILGNGRSIELPLCNPHNTACNGQINMWGIEVFNTNVNINTLINNL